MLWDSIKEFKICRAEEIGCILSHSYSLNQGIKKIVHRNILILFKNIKKIKEKEFPHICILVIFFQSKYKWLIQQKCVIIPDLSKMGKQSEELSACLVLKIIIWGSNFEGVFKGVNYSFDIIGGLFYYSWIPNPKICKDFKR